MYLCPRSQYMYNSVNCSIWSGTYRSDILSENPTTNIRYRNHQPENHLCTMHKLHIVWIRRPFSLPYRCLSVLLQLLHHRPYNEQISVCSIEKLPLSAASKRCQANFLSCRTNKLQASHRLYQGEYKARLYGYRWSRYLPISWLW